MWLNSILRALFSILMRFRFGSHDKLSILKSYYANSYVNYVKLEIRISKFETNTKFKLMKSETTTLLGLKTLPHLG